MGRFMAIKVIAVDIPATDCNAAACAILLTFLVPPFHATFFFIVLLKHIMNPFGFFPATYRGYCMSHI